MRRPVGCLWVPLKCLRVPLECILCARQGAHMDPGQVSDQCQIVLGANLANLGPYPFGRTLWKRGVQYATKHMRISCWGPVWDRFRSTFNSAGQVPRAFSVRGTFSRRSGHMLFFCTGAGTHNCQIASKGLQYRVKRRVLDQIRPPFTLQNVQCSIETIFAF